jgi:hypothetical protein
VLDEDFGLLEGAGGGASLPHPIKPPGFGQSGSSSGKRQFSNDWKIFFQWLEIFSHFFQ